MKDKKKRFDKIKERQNVKIDKKKNEVTFDLENGDVSDLLEVVKDMEDDTDMNSLLLKDYMNIALDRVRKKRLHK